MSRPTEGRDDATARLVEELRQILIKDWLRGAHLLLSEQDGWVQLHIMAIDLGMLGTLLATLNDPEELAKPGALSRRMAPGGPEGRPDDWQYELTAGRYSDLSIVFSARVRLPATDLPEVILRLSQGSE